MKYIGVLILVGCCNFYAFAAEAAVTLNGKVLDQKTKQIVDSRVTVFYDNDIVEIFSGTTEKGEFMVSLEDEGWYIISIIATGYLETTDTLWVVNENTTVLNKEYYLAPIEIGLTVTLRNIYFNSTKASLTEESFPELNRVVPFFMQNPHITFEIAGHTDNYGDEDYNLQLSQQRAQAVVDYLVGQGVNRSQLLAHGYGETKPIDVTGTRAGLAKNRRVEFTVLTITEPH